MRLLPLELEGSIFKHSSNNFQIIGGVNCLNATSYIYVQEQYLLYIYIQRKKSSVVPILKRGAYSNWKRRVLPMGWKYHIVRQEINLFWAFKCMQIARIQEKLTKKVGLYRKHTFCLDASYLHKFRCSE